VVKKLCVRKSKQSKLDPHSAELERWFDDKWTLDQAREELLKRYSLSVSPSLLSDWWEKRQQQRMQDRVLDRISSGAQAVKAVEKQFAKDAPPEVETLIKLHRVLIMQLSLQATANPDLLKTATDCMKPVMAYLKVQEQRADRSLEERRLAILEQKAKQAEEAEEITSDKKLSPEEKQQRLRAIFGMT
jgi:vacuolar-type H+-ATPase catalytic subunit A/Vma1